MRLCNNAKHLSVGCVEYLWTLTLSWIVLSVLPVINTGIGHSFAINLSGEVARVESLRTRPRQARVALHLEDLPFLENDEQRQNDKFLRQFHKVLYRYLSIVALCLKWRV